MVVGGRGLGHLRSRSGRRHVRWCWVRLFSCFLGLSDRRAAFWGLALFLVKLFNLSLSQC